MQTIGALLFLAHSILDGCDGELARLKFQQSRWGGVLDFWGDNVVHSVIFGCMGVGWSLSAGAIWPLALGAGAVLGTLGSAGFVYWRLMRVKDGATPCSPRCRMRPGARSTRLLDSASRRDFIYLVILLALFGRSNWFLVMAGIGAPIYFLLVLFAARPQGGAAGDRLPGRAGRKSDRALAAKPASVGTRKRWRACFRSMSGSRATSRGRAKPSIPASGKRRCQGRRMARRLNIDGDGQGDLEGHGGEHRAVFVYQIEFVPLLASSASAATTSLTASSARISRSTACPTQRCASATITGSEARCSR